MTEKKESLISTSTKGNYRFPGSRPFYDTDVDRCLFFGREQETQLLLHKTLNWDIVVLYAKSGLGKTSLINAGFNQELRDRGYVPISVRMNNPDIADPLPAFFQGIKDFAARENLDYEHGEEDSLWQFFRTSFFWGSENEKLKPVVIMDQFEEFFTSYSKEKRKTFIRNLADMVNNTAPGELLASFPPGQKLPYSLDPPGVKIIISIREDFLGQLEEMSKSIPVILNHRFRLMPLTRQQAKQAIIEPSQVRHKAIRADSFKFTPEAVDMILDFLCKQRERDEIKISDEVEPFQLQILCRHFEDKSREKGKKNEDEVTIEKEDLGGEKGMQQVLLQFYEEQLKKLDSFVKRKRVRRLLEKGLISIDDRRLILEEGVIKRKYRLSEGLLVELVNSRLLRLEPRLGSNCYELAHETMVKPIRESQKKRNAKNKKIVIIFLFVLIFIIGLSWRQIEKQIDEGITNFIVLIKGKDSYINTLYENAQKLKMAGQNNSALEIFDKILNIDKTQVLAHLKKGEILCNLGEYGKAINTYKEAIDHGIKDERIYYQWGQTYFKNGQIKKSIKKYLESLEIYSNSPLLYEALGDVYQHQQQFRKAVENYKRALEIDKNNSVVYKKLAISYISFESPEKAVETFNKALNVSPGYANICKDISDALKSKNRIDLVEKIYDISYKSNSIDYSIYTSMGHHYLQRKNYERSIECFKKAINIAPEDPLPYIWLGSAYSEHGEHSAAVEVIGKALKLNSGSANAYDSMGYSLLKQGKYDDAIKAYKKSIDISPENFSTKMNLIEAYFIAKRFDQLLKKANEFLKKRNIRIDYKLALRLMIISSLIFKEKHYDALFKLKEFIKYYKSISIDYSKRRWSYSIIREFIKKDEKLPEKEKFLLIQIINLIELPKDRDRNKILDKIESLVSISI